MDATNPYQDTPLEPHARHHATLSIAVSLLCYASLLLALYLSSQLLG